jgi:CelD/BcsL family acetyltransferase involved in cellulose biosynthesis
MASGSPLAVAAISRPKLRTSVVEVRELRTLLGLTPAWEHLAEAALEPNVFYEPWMLLPALATYGAGKDIRIVLVLIDDPRSAAPRVGALFPFARVRNFRNLGISALSLWQHLHCYVCTPLVRADAARECIEALLRWFQSGEAGASLLEMQCIAGDGPIHDLLIGKSGELGLAGLETDAFSRGLWTKNASADPGSAVSADLRRTLRRKERRLRERGRMEHRALRPEGDDVGRWINEFLRLEAGGWKGSAGTALAHSESSRRYFEEVATFASRRGRLLMLGLDFDGQPIARRCTFAAGRGSFAFKTAYDETFAEYSPGAMLEMDSIEQLRALPRVEWMDSCAAPDNLLINRISNGRRTIRSLAFGTGTLGEVVISGLPLLRWTHRRMRKWNSTE